MFSGLRSRSEKIIAPIFFQLLKSYTIKTFKNDLFAGLDMALVSLPLSMALGIASGTTPDRGLFTAIITGIIASIFTGSRFQITGPTGAFVLVIFQIMQQYGYDGLVLASLLAGVLLMIISFFGLGHVIKYVPYPVMIGFSAGIAIFIIFKEIKGFFGFNVENIPSEFFKSVVFYAKNLDKISINVTLLSLGTIFSIFFVNKKYPKFPIFLLSILFTSLLIHFLNIPINTIGSIFGNIPSSIPYPKFPSDISFDLFIDIIPSALTITMLAGMESLLSAAIADSMTGSKHYSNAELFSQGVSNIFSVIFGGIPATGSASRTAANVRSGAKTPMAGLFQALFILIFVYFGVSFAYYIPISTLSVLLIFMSYKMIDFDHIKNICMTAKAERIILLTTIFLTLLTDITVAVSAGVILAFLMFSWRLISLTEGHLRARFVVQDNDDLEQLDLQEHVQILRLRGPFFFGITSTVEELLLSLDSNKNIFILDLKNVPFIDTTGLRVLKKWIKNDKNVIFACPHEPLRKHLNKVKIGDVCCSIKEAIDLCKAKVGDTKE